MAFSSALGQDYGFASHKEPRIPTGCLWPPRAPTRAEFSQKVFHTDHSSLFTMRVEASFAGLSGTVTSSHIHASNSMVPFTGTAGVATMTPSFTLFPSAVTSGVYDMTFDMTLPASYNVTYISANGGSPAAAFTALQAQMASGRSYLNIHTTAFGGGEIRGILTPVPEPGTTGLAALAGLGLLMRRRRA